MRESESYALLFPQLFIALVTISWKMTGAQLAFYLLLVSGLVTLFDVNVGSMPGKT